MWPPLMTVVHVLIWLTTTLISTSACPEHCTCPIDTVICTNLYLTSIPNDIPQNTKYLYLDHNSITAISANLNGLANLLVLSISNNHLNRIEDDALRDLDNLLEVDLSFNNLHHESLSSEVFANLTKLCVLNLARNDFGPAAPRLVLNPEEGRFALNLSRNSLSELGENVFVNILHIDTLDLSHNLISDVGESEYFEGLQELRTLILSHNKIESQPQYGFTPIKNLETLLLDNNRIDQLPNLVNNSHLHELDCSHNNIYRLLENDYIYVTNSELRTLRLSYNQFGWPPSWNGLRTLHALYLDGNAIDQIDIGPAPDVQLRLLELSNQSAYIKVIYEGTFDIFTHLEYLGLSWNDGVNFVGNVFEHLPHIKYLYMNHTYQDWGSDSFSLYGLGRKRGLECPFLELDISNSGLSYLSHNVFSSFDWDVPDCDYIRVKLDGNPWDCGCDLSYYRRWYEGNPATYPDLQCWKPDMYRGKWMSEVPDRIFTCVNIQMISVAVAISLAVLFVMMLISAIAKCVMTPVGNIDYTSNGTGIDEHSPIGYQQFPPSYGSIN